MKLYDRECSFLIRVHIILLEENRLKPETIRISQDVPQWEEVRKDIQGFPQFSLDHKTLKWQGLGQLPNGQAVLYSITPVWKV